ncbi:MAG: BamA/TamA family outer membrane protein [Solitalea-like symbiont of Acarus siro]
MILNQNKISRVFKYCIHTLLLCISLQSCISKNIPNNDSLYTGAKITYTNTDKKQIDKVLKDKIKSLTTPRENTKLLGMPLKLWIYNLANPNSNRGLNKVLKNFGEPPVLTSQVNIKENINTIKIAMENEGFFLNEVEGNLNNNKKTSKALYEIDAKQRWKFDTIEAYNKPESEVQEFINTSLNNTIIETDTYYSLDTLKAERERINLYLKQRGYFYFDPSYIVFYADTNTTKYQVRLQPKIKADVSKIAMQKWYINKIIINTDYKIKKDSEELNSNLYKDYSFNIMDKNPPFYKPQLFINNIFIRPYDLYNYDDHLLSIQRLMEKNIFSFVKVDFKQSSLDQHLDVFFLLNSMKQRFIRIEIGSNIKSNNFLGSGINITHQNRNLFRQGEYLNVSLKTGLDYQISGDKSVIKSNAYNITLSSSLIFPRLVTPFYKVNAKKLISPKTKIGLDASLLNSPNNYRLLSLSLLAGYSFNSLPWFSHTINALDITYVLPQKISPEFQSELDKDPVKKRAFQKQYIVSTNYSVNYQNNTFLIKPIDYKLIGEIDAGGNILGLIFKSYFAQYIKLSTTGITYINLSPALQLANRLIIGYGYSYGNSYSLPYIKQFYVGGPYSIRAFRTRMLGPGAFKPDEPSTFRDEAGDIKLEFNTELRFPIVSMLKGAAFLDIGNIWNLRHNETREGGKFTYKFLNQLAIGTGLGLRIDISLFIIRLDVAFPIRMPWPTKGSNWVINHINPFDSNWRKENLIYNFAIGYPF